MNRDFFEKRKAIGSAIGFLFLFGVLILISSVDLGNSACIIETTAYNATNHRVTANVTTYCENWGGPGSPYKSSILPYNWAGITHSWGGPGDSCLSACGSVYVDGTNVTLNIWGETIPNPRDFSTEGANWFSTTYYHSEDVIMNMSILSYGNSTTNITYPFENDSFIEDDVFNVTVNVSSVGGNLTGCSVTLNVSNSSVLNITSVNPFIIGDLAENSFNWTSFNITAIGVGVSNITALTVCTNGEDSNDSVFNVTVQEEPVLPNLINVTTDNITYYKGNTINFTGYWNESASDVKLLIDDDTSFLNCNFTEQSGCIANSSATSSSPVIVSMNASSSTKWYARFCNIDGCSSRAMTYNWSMDEDLSDADASFWGEDGGDYSGYSVSSAGDVNGDGYDDLLIGAYNDGDGGNAAGQTYLILGKASGWSMDIDLNQSNASFWGEDADDYSGYSVSSAGDVNGDGYDDLLIGAYEDEEGGGGQTYLILGKASGWSMDEDLNDADASFIGEGGNWAGISVSSAGDVNGDGYDDLLIGANQDDDGGTDAGKTYLILGKSSGWSMDVNLSNANASFWGEDAGDESGYSVSSAGDVNGDGYDDLLIGAKNDDDGGSNAGQTYLIFGKANGWNMDIDLNQSNASFWGEDADDYSGYSVSSAGDVNGDGYDDLLIGAIGDEDGGSMAGQTYLILGKATGWNMDIDLNQSNASFWGEDGSDYSGTSVSSAGDVNGDGYDDLLIGAYGDDDGGGMAGQTYLILGKSSGWSMDTDLSNSNASFWGEDGGDYSGGSLSNVGDVNGDGYDDLLIGAYGSGSYMGQTYLILSKYLEDDKNDSGSVVVLDVPVLPNLINVTTDNITYYNGDTINFTGYWNESSSDVKLLIDEDTTFLNCNFTDTSGCIANSSATSTSPVVVSMVADSSTKWYARFCSVDGCSSRAMTYNWSMDEDLSDADASFIGEDLNDNSGRSVSSAGDVNGDGYDDLLIGAYYDEDGGIGAGQTYLILGKSTGWGMDYDLSRANASFWGEDLNDNSAWSVSSAGDVNGDGYDDLLIGAFGDDDGGSDAGQTYLIFGKSTGWSMDTDLSNANASFWGEDATDSSGYSVSSAGDVNGDGYDDLLIGAYLDEDGGIGAGQTYLILGKSTGWEMDVDLSNANASFIGEDLWDYSGYSVSSAGDVNGDGYDDLLIGAYGDDDGGSDAGQTYLILGKSTGWGMDIDLSNSNASFIGEDADDRTGYSVSSAGDVNGDGYDDLLIGAYGDEDGGINAGQTYLILGKPTGWEMDVDLSNANASFWGEDGTDYSGYSVSSAGDVNGDGYDDLLIGAYGDDDGGSDAGQTYLILGKSTGWTMDYDLSNANASFWGEDATDYSGYSVSSAGDVNGDGYNDILIGAYGDDDGGINAGQTYLILSKYLEEDKNDSGRIVVLEDINAPTVNLIFPANETLTSNTSLIFVFNATDDFGLKNATLYVWNSTGLFGTNTTDISGTFNESSLNLSGFSVGNYHWNVLVYDEVGNSAWADGNWTFTINALLEVNLISPANDTSNSNVNQTFTCNATGSNLVNITLYVWNSTGEIYYNNLTNVSGSFNETSWNVTNMSYDNYTWNCLAYSTDNYSWADENWTLEISDIQSPNITSIILNSSLGTNYTTENLTAYPINVTPSNSKVIYNWKKNGSSIAVLNMPFEGGSNSTWTKDYSDNGNDGIVNGSLWNSSGGYDGKGAYSFDAIDDSIDVGNNFNFERTQAFSGVAWIKKTDDDSTDFLMSNARMSVNNFRGWEWHTNGSNIKWRLASDTSANNYMEIEAATTNIDDNNWHHVAFTYAGGSNASNVSLYVDGQAESLVVTMDNLSATTVQNNNLLIGGRDYMSTIFWNGSIDEVLIFNHSLSAEQILALYNNDTNLIVSQETNVDDVWQACATPNDGVRDGNEVCSGNLSVLEIPTPNITSIILNSSTGTNYTNESLTAWVSNVTPSGSDIYGKWKKSGGWYVNLTHIDNSQGGGSSRGVWGDGNYIYSANDGNGIASYSVNSTGGLTHIDNNSQGGGSSRGVWGDGNYIYSANDGNGIASYSVNSTGGLTHIDNHTPGSNCYGVWGDGNYIYLVCGVPSGLHVYSVNSTGHLTHIDSYNPGGFPYGVWGDGNYVYIANQGVGIEVYSVNSTGGLTWIDNDDQGGNAYRVWGDGNYIYLANAGRGLEVYSVNSTGGLTWIDNDYSGGSAYGVWGDGNYIYLANNLHGMEAYSVNSTGGLTWIDNDDQGGQAQNLWGDGNYIYLANAGRGLEVYSAIGSIILKNYTLGFGLIDTLGSSYTSVGDNWSVCAIPNYEGVSGDEVCSGNLTILDEPSVPEVLITYPLEYSAYIPNVTSINYTVSGGESCWYSTDWGTSNSSSVSAGTGFSTNFEIGEYNLTVYCNNSIGNVSDDSIKFIIGDFETSNEVNKIQASDNETLDFFGHSVSISGDYAIIGAYGEDTGANDVGAAYIFKKNSGGQFEEINKIQASDAQLNDHFGHSVSISGDYAIVGADRESSSAGAAYIFKKNSTGQFEEVNKLVASDAGVNDYFGDSVSISGDYAIVGAYYESTGGAEAGAAYIFKKNSTGQFEEVNKIMASDAQAEDYFGHSVSISGDYAIVGAYAYDGLMGEGKAFIFKKNSTGQFEEVNRIQSSNPQDDYYFGHSVSISGDYAIIGAYGEVTALAGTGAAYIFKKNSTGQFEEVNRMQASDNESDDWFGHSVSISGDYAIVGSHREDTGGNNIGASYIFKKNSTGQFEEINKIQASDKQDDDEFGKAVSISGDYAIIGAMYEDTSGVSTGAAYLFKLDYLPLINVSLVSPANDTLTTNDTLTFTFNATGTALKNATLYVWNSTGLFGTNFTNISGVFNESSFDLSNFSIGDYHWNVLVYDEAGNNEWAESNWTFTINALLEVNLISPANDTSNSNVNQTFTCNATGSNLANMTLYVWNSTGGVYYNNLTNVSGSFNESSWNVTNMSYDNYTWNCLAYDSDNSSWANENWTLEIKNVTSGWTDVITPEGVFEPDDGGGPYAGTHVNTFKIHFIDLTISPTDELSCDIAMSNGAIRRVNATGLDLVEQNATLNYTVLITDSIIEDGVVGYVPWILKNCSINDGATFFENRTTWYNRNSDKSFRIHVHDAGLWPDGAVTRAVACIGGPNSYFNNTAKCEYLEDVNFAVRMRNGADLNDTCFNAPGYACGDDLCNGITFPTCDPFEYWGTYNALTEDPNGYTIFTSSFGSYNVPITYTRYTNTSGEGTFKVRVGPVAIADTYTFTIMNISNASSVNVYGAQTGGAEVTDVVSDGDGNYNVRHNRLGTSFTGTLDFTFNVSFSQGLEEARDIYMIIGIGTENNGPGYDYFPINFSLANGLYNNDESQTTSWTTGFPEGTVCGDEANNDFDYIGGTWDYSYDCFDVDCNGSQGDNTQINFFGTRTGLCNYQTETNCSDEFDNDYDSITLGYDSTDCHDSDCFQSSGDCPSVELICNNSLNDDWDYTFGEGDNFGDQKIDNNGTKYDALHQANLQDCEDIDCDGQVGGNPTQLCNWGKELNCSDGFDNDDLQLWDCQLSAVGGSTSMVSPANAEYDCDQYCRVTTSTEIGATCMDNIDNDWDAIVLSGNYSDQYSVNGTYGSGIDCRWGGYFGIGSNYNPDEDCNTTTLTNGFDCELGQELNCTDGFDNDFDHDAVGMPHAGWDAASYNAYFATAYSNDADFDDYDCAGHANAPANESINAAWCFDGIDNDLDVYFANSSGYFLNSSSDVGIDCNDLDCLGVENPAIPGQFCSLYEYNASAGAPYNNPLRCNDALDNDADGPIDCADSDCAGQFDLCSSGQCKDSEDVTWDSCFDGSNNDYSGGIDCADADCVGMFGSSQGMVCSSGAGTENSNFTCSDGFDNNVAGGADCADSSNSCDNLLGGKVNGTDVYCRNSESTASDCADGFDNDGDGQIDCYDDGCLAHCPTVSVVVGSSITALPQYSGQVTVPPRNQNTELRVDQSTDEVRKGENYSLTLRGWGSTHAEWFIGTAAGGDATKFNHSAFDNTTAYLSGADASDFSLTVKSNGYEIISVGDPIGNYVVTLNVQSTAVMVSNTYELYVSELAHGTGNVNMNYAVRENVVPVAQAINVSPQVGIDYGGQLQIRANASDNNQFGRCEFAVWGAGSASGNSNSCKYAFSPTVQGIYYINATPRDHYDNVGSVFTQSYVLNIRPTGSSTTTDEEFYHQTDLVDFTANFNVAAGDVIGNGNVYVKNESGEYHLGICTGAGNACSNSSLNVSALGDGTYTIFAKVQETNDGDLVESLGKGIFVCTGDNGLCGFTDFDSNGLADICVLSPPYVVDLNESLNVINQTELTNLSSNVTDDGVVVEVLTQITYPDLTFENFTMSGPVGDIYSLLFGNGFETWQTGLYLYKIIATDDQNSVNDTEFGNFTVLVWDGFGNSTMNITFPFNNDSYDTFELFNVTVNITADGNLSNCSAKLDITNQSAINFSVGESEVHFIGNLTNTSVVNETWILQAVGNGSVEVTTTVYCYRGASSYDKINLTALADFIAPEVNNVTSLPSEINQTDSVNLSANVTDNRAVDTVIARVTYPDLVDRDVVMDNVSVFDIYEYLFSDSAQTGLYLVTILANDTSGNLNDTETTNFTALVWPGFGNTTTNITGPGNDSAYNASDTFELNVSIEGIGILENCSAMISFNTTVLSVASDVIDLGNITDNQTNISWTVTAKNNVSTTVTVTTYCDRGASSYSKIFNITVYGMMNVTGIDAPLEFMIYINASGVGNAELNWSVVSGTEGYKVWYSDNATEILRMNETVVTSERGANMTLVGVNNISWVDITAGNASMRFYAVAAYVGTSMNVSVDKLGKYDHILNNETVIGHTYISIPFNQTVNLSEVLPTPTMSGTPSFVTHRPGATDVFDSSLYFLGKWNPQGTFNPDNLLEPTLGYYVNGFGGLNNFTSYGPLIRGNRTVILNNETVVGHTYIGIPSFTRKVNLSEVLPTPTMSGTPSFVTHRPGATDVFDSSLYFLGKWNPQGTFNPDNLLEPTLGYYVNGFGGLNNFTYECNPI